LSSKRRYTVASSWWRPGGIELVGAGNTKALHVLWISPSLKFFHRPTLTPIEEGGTRACSDGDPRITAATSAREGSSCNWSRACVGGYAVVIGLVFNPSNLFSLQIIVWDPFMRGPTGAGGGGDVPTYQPTITSRQLI
jgi:hypothetical protein